MLAISGEALGNGAGGLECNVCTIMLGVRADMQNMHADMPNKERRHEQKSAARCADRIT